MSIYALPVSINDLMLLQAQIEFFTDPTQAQQELALINNGSQTVFGYANELIDNNLSFSQVAVAMDFYMFGTAAGLISTFEVAKLSTQFLPAQVGHAIDSGFNPTVYAAEAVGLALAGGDGTSNAFAQTFGQMNISAFSQAVSNITGVSTNQIETWVTNWLGFYIKNPPVGVSEALGAYGAAFGDAVGSALVNSPPVNLRVALLHFNVQNALLDNAEGIIGAKGVVPISSLPLHDPLQGEGQSSGGPVINASDLMPLQGVALASAHGADVHLLV